MERQPLVSRQAIWAQPGRYRPFCGYAGYAQQLAGLAGPQHPSDEPQASAQRLLIVIALLVVTAILWRKDFFDGVYRFFILFKASQPTVFFVQ